MESQEVSAKSVDEAVEIALERLGAKLSEVEIVILSEGRAGILGLGAEDARVRVTKLDVGRSRMSANFPPRPPAISYASSSHVAERAVEQGPAAVADSTGVGRTGREVLEDLLDLIGLDAKVTDAKPLNIGSTASATAAFDIQGPDLGVLIGRRGQTLSALQYLVNLILNKKLKSHVAVTVDVGGYRARRYESLRGLAQRMAERVRSTGHPVTLEPMTAAERRIIHLALQDYADIATQSVGEGENRKVSIIRKAKG